MKAVQSALRLTLPLRLNHDGWVNHDGVASAASDLALWAVQGGDVWLRSEGVAGKSHLLQALAHDLDHSQVTPIHPHSHGSVNKDASRLSAAWLEGLQGQSHWLLDIAAGALEEHAQLALFHLIERARRQAVPLVIAWRCDDHAITRAELLTRLRTMQQITLQSPSSDHDLQAVLEAELARMQWTLNRTVLHYLLTHTHRDFGTLLLQLHTLHQQSLVQHCRPSLSNIRHLLEQQQPVSA